MEKLEIKLTLTADSTPELLRYLRGISSARDRAFILKRLATAGLLGLGNGSSPDAVLLPSPASARSAPAVTEQPSVTAAPNVQLQPIPRTASVAGAQSTAGGDSPAAVAPPLSPVNLQRTPPTPSTSAPGLEFLDLEALVAATAQFA